MSYTHSKYITKKISKLKVLMIGRCDPYKGEEMDCFVVKFQNDFYFVDGFFTLSSIEDAYKIINEQDKYNLNFYPFDLIKERYNNLNGASSDMARDRIINQMNIVNTCLRENTIKNLLNED